MQTSIYVTWEFEGFHKWANAPKPQAFLRHRHRHIFKCKATIEVEHDDRDIEFFALKEELSNLRFRTEKDNIGSCEMIAKRYMGYLENTRTGRRMSVEVSEDGENGAIVSNG